MYTLILHTPYSKKNIVFWKFWLIDWKQQCEYFSLFHSGPVNLAVDKLNWQSSGMEDSPEIVVANSNQRCHHATWWVVDLRSTYQVTEILVTISNLPESSK